jgi:hypothetical protein
VYYYDATAGNLRTARWTGAVWTFAALDGAGGTGGQLNEDVGLYTSAISYLNHPRVFYYDATAGTLRYAVRVGTTWHYATLDGQGGAAGQTGDAVGEDIATVVFGGVLHVYYYDMTSGDQREAVLQPSGAWSYSTLDGEGGAAGHINADTGQFNAATVVGNTLHVLSHDATNGDLRHAWLTAGVWHFETLDGNTTVGGRTTNETGTDNLALTVGSTLQLWYSDETGGVLRHASLDAFGWHFENLDGLGGAAGRINAVVGEYVTGVTDGTSMDIWYFADAGDLRYAQFA